MYLDLNFEKKLIYIFAIQYNLDFDLDEKIFRELYDRIEYTFQDFNVQPRHFTTYGYGMEICVQSNFICIYGEDVRKCIPQRI